ncbi:hypothetical protein SAMN05216338_104054 [Bradyrhizobium sp. Rc2d]|nr:hypothetical protein SAMN05216338_104054 [Bradyrhizobium sp. Rc2d]
MPKRNLPNSPHRNDSFFRCAFGKALRCKELGAQVSPRGAGIKVRGGGITGMGERVEDGLDMLVLPDYPME